MTAINSLSGRLVWIYPLVDPRPIPLVNFGRTIWYVKPSWSCSGPLNFWPGLPEIGNDREQNKPC